VKRWIEPVAVPAGYHCPLCPDHRDERFGCHSLIPVPLCDACLIELDQYALTRYPALRSDWRRHADTLEELAGRPWRELRTVIIREQLDDWSILHREKRGPWLDGMLAHGWSRERCEEFITEKVTELRVAAGDAEIEHEAHRLIG
jgi:hypothetical protein